MKTCIFQTKMILDKDISRGIEISGNVSLYRFAEAIVSAYGWHFDHCFGFYSNMVEDYFDSARMYELFADLEDDGIEPTKADSVKETKIMEVWKSPGDKMMFLFDYGDGWRFSVELKAFGEKSKDKKYPRTLKKVGKSLKQYPAWE